MVDKRKGLRIKNEETCRLITELALLEGVTKTEAVTRALRSALARERALQQPEREDAPLDLPLPNTKPPAK